MSVPDARLTRLTDQLPRGGRTAIPLAVAGALIEADIEPAILAQSVINGSQQFSLPVIPCSGRNTVLDGHDHPVEAATAVHPEALGAVWVVRPGGPRGFTPLGRIKPDALAGLR